MYDVGAGDIFSEAVLVKIASFPYVVASITADVSTSQPIAIISLAFIQLMTILIPQYSMTLFIFSQLSTHDPITAFISMNPSLVIDIDFIFVYEISEIEGSEFVESGKDCWICFSGSFIEHFLQILFWFSQNRKDRLLF